MTPSLHGPGHEFFFRVPDQPAGSPGRATIRDPGATRSAYAMALQPDDVWAAPQAQGLYDPALEKDSCGVGFIADIKGRKSHADRKTR